MTNWWTSFEVTLLVYTKVVIHERKLENINEMKMTSYREFAEYAELPDKVKEEGYSHWSP